MGKEPVIVIFCNCSHCLTENIDTKRIKTALLEDSNINDVLVIVAPCKDKYKKLNKTSFKRAVIGGCSIMENRGIYNEIITDLDLKKTNYSIIDIRTSCIDLYASKKEREDNLLQQLLIQASLLSAREEFAVEKILPYQKILIYGDGYTGLSLAHEIPGQIPVDILETGDNKFSPGYFSEKTTRPDMIENLKKSVFSRENINSICPENPVQIIPDDKGFQLLFDDGKGVNYGAIVFAPERMESKITIPGVLSLSEIYTMIEKDDIKKGVILFIMDYDAVSGPEVFADTLSAAWLIKKKYLSDVYVLTKNVQVCIKGQEELYDECRSEGVIFIKYDTGLNIKNNTGQSVVKGTDIQTAESFRFDNCDLVVVPGKSRLSMEAVKFAEMLKITLPENRYSQADSLWILPNKTERAGVFTAGICRENYGSNEAHDDIISCVFETINYIYGSESEVGEYISVIDEEACAYCLTCVRVCPFGAMTKNPEKRIARVLASACQGCGICVAECPANALELRNMEASVLRKSIGSYTE